MKCWEITADELSASDWGWGCPPQVDFTGRVLFMADAQRNNGKDSSLLPRKS
jgi:hypothetical protein